MINDRSMRGPRRCDTRWPQTIVMRRAHRQANNPYRRSRRRLTWGGLLDALCWAVVVVGGFAGGAWLLSATVSGLSRAWQ